ncbi:hypothetical protein CYLTODRAFT_451657 [Cylindrobasidium torrendii FP15055 ss-10]|uniref:Uncharacterized protein n=1 Tax=Cylindrobasidium torrendii FP15055 ss-10 TaxID=1314674 RepID=A0A0D7BJ46_9AGAR|nr:hypothetical protein CYLTODRAFT_451657 [Cylindrobasidium torrendii FP15055 ss-10]
MASLRNVCVAGRVPTRQAYKSDTQSYQAIPPVIPQPDHDQERVGAMSYEFLDAAPDKIFPCETKPSPAQSGTRHTWPYTALRAILRAVQVAQGILKDQHHSGVRDPDGYGGELSRHPTIVYSMQHPPAKDPLRIRATTAASRPVSVTGTETITATGNTNVTTTATKRDGTGLWTTQVVMCTANTNPRMKTLPIFPRVDAYHAKTSSAMYSPTSLALAISFYLRHLVPNSCSMAYLWVQQRESKQCLALFARPSNDIPGHQPQTATTVRPGRRKVDESDSTLLAVLPPAISLKDGIQSFEIRLFIASLVSLT